MDKIRKLFGEYEMTWKRLIIFSILCGAYTAATLLIPGVNETALKEIGVGYECWFILAIFVISNCKSAKEAAIKCFVFFLVSQPLIYLIQMLFTSRNLLAEYYMPWFIKTILTIPGAVLAYQIKRINLFGTLVLAFAGTAVAFMGEFFFINALSPLKISYIIYGIILVAASMLLGLIFCKNKRLLIVYIIIIIIACIVLSFIFSNYFTSSKKYEMPLSDENWFLTNCTFINLNAEINDDILVIDYYNRNSSGEISMENEKGEEHHYYVYSQNGSLVIEDRNK